MRVRLAVVLLAASGCSRDFDLPSRVDRLAVEPAFSTLAPRERETLQAVGGSPPYSFRFADGGQLSGDDATLDLSTGAYQAGSRGSAVDVLAVVDASGRAAEGRVAVGAPLALSPAAATAAPGGVITFTGSGGKPPYAYAVTAGPCGGEIEPTTGRYRAAAAGNCTDEVVLSDATADAAARALAPIDVGQPLQLFVPGADTVPPFVALALIAVGGAPPYRFELATNASGGTLDLLTGSYQAGATGGVDDWLEVVDANDQRARHAIHVGPALSLSLSSTWVRAGEPVRLSAAGGAPPYVFSFAFKGNRSQGAVNPISGDYTPGDATSVSDRVQVEDSTGRAIATLTTSVQGRRLLFTGGARCLAADLDGDSYDDLVTAALGATACRGCGGRNRIVTSIFSARGVDLDQRRYLLNDAPYSYLADLYVDDLDGDRHADVVALVADHPTNLTDTGSRLLVYPAGSDGTLGVPVEIHSGVALGSAFVGARNVAATTPGSSHPAHSFFFVERPPAVTCARAAGQVGLLRLDWQGGAPAPDPAVCTEVVDGDVVRLVVGDWNGDTELDLAWTQAKTTSTLQASFGPLFTARDVIALGGSLATYSPYGSTDPTPTVLGNAAVADLTGDGRDDLVLLATDNVRSYVRLATNPSTTWSVLPTSTTAYDPTPTALWSLGFSVFQPRAADPASLVAWNGMDGTLTRFGWNTTTSAFESLQPALPKLDMSVDCITTGDFDNDGLPDLAVTSIANDSSEVLLGDGDGGLARRPRLPSDGPLMTTTDVDGDGLDDIVARSGQGGVAVLFGGDHLLAAVPEVSTSERIEGLAAADFDGDSAGHVDLIAQRESGGLIYLEGDGSGAFAPEVLLTQPGGGLDTGYLATLSVAELGGAAPGPDLVSRQAYSGYRAVATVRSGVTEARRVYTSSLAGACDLVAVELSGDAVDDLVMACANTGHVAVYKAVATGSGASLAFGSWQTISADVGAAIGHTGISAVGRAADRAFFLSYQTSSPPTVTAALLVVSSSSVWTLPIRSPEASESTLSIDARKAVLGDLDGDDVPDLAMAWTATNKPRTFLSRGQQGGTFVFHDQVPSGGNLSAVAALGEPGYGDLVFIRPAEQIVIVPNDGAGGF
ncbi:MAG: VCBS repeat-containing protein [Deltaproteobacteria bacterium]|nr:VCBS repeat-containing protein [Deltaproteobacteria bacterium]